MTFSGGNSDFQEQVTDAKQEKPVKYKYYTILQMRPKVTKPLAQTPTGGKQQSPGRRTPTTVDTASIGPASVTRTLGRCFLTFLIKGYEVGMLQD